MITVYAQSRAWTVPQLRMLVANEQLRVDELAAAMDSMEITELSPAWLYRCEQAAAQLQRFQRLLSAQLLAEEMRLKLNPAAPSAETSAGSLVTTEAARSGSLSE